MEEHPRFDLIDQPWIPVIRLTDGRLVDVGVRDILTDPGSYREISDPSPLITISLHRLLLAILHRSLQGPRDSAEWYRIWTEGWDVEGILAKLDEWQGKNCFDLFDPERPFYQTKDIEYEYETSIADVVHGLTLGNYSTLFDHNSDAAPPALSPAEAARALVGFQNFAPGGLISYRSKAGEPRPQFGSADAGLLTKSAVVLIIGDDLRQTLTLNLHQYTPGGDIPFTFHGEDKPTWERDDPATGQDRAPAGYVDLLTWQSRRMRFRPERLANGDIAVRYTVRMKGDQLPERGELVNYETMVPFRKNTRSGRSQPSHLELALRPDRALWRDSTVLFQSVEGNNQPKTTEWLASLATNRYLDRNRRYNLDLFGMAVDRASIFLWRHERLPLSLTYLEDTELFRTLQEALELAESAGRLLSSGWVPAPAGVKAKSVPSPMRVLAANLVSPVDESNADPDAIRRTVSSLAPEPVYWSRLDVPFTRFMLRLAEIWDPDDLESDAVLSLMDNWAREVRRIVLEAFQEVTDSLDLNDRELQAMAKGERQLYWQLNQLIDPFMTEREEVRA